MKVQTNARWRFAVTRRNAAPRVYDGETLISVDEDPQRSLVSAERGEYARTYARATSKFRTLPTGKF